jgi:hypothetical protein
MLKIDPASMREAALQITGAIAFSIEKEANRLLTVDAFASDAGESRYIITYTGALGNSSAVTVTGEGAEITWSAPYASDIEFGVLPGEKDPYVMDIYNWLTTKKSGKLPLTEEEARRAAPLVRDKIIREGWSPRPFVRTAIDHVAASDSAGGA